MVCRVEKIDGPNDGANGFAHKKMMGDFKKKLDSAKIMQDIRRREYYESPGVERRRKRKEAENQKLRALQESSSGNHKSKKNKKDERRGTNER